VAEPLTAAGFAPFGDVIERRTTPDRMINQAIVDNAHALSGIQETSNLALQFNSVETRQEIWHVVITKIVENTNAADDPVETKTLVKAIELGLRPLPKVN
jgi:ureidoglycolate hydrolase